MTTTTARKVVATLATAIGLSVIACGSRSSTDTKQDTEIEAKIICEKFVKQRLKAPATADFSETDATDSGGGDYTVTGAVDAENSFGAKLRMNYRCVIHDAGEEWRLKGLTGLD